MNGFEWVAGIIGAFFAIGFAVGALLVIALPASRRRSGAGHRLWARIPFVDRLPGWPRRRR